MKRGRETDDRADAKRTNNDLDNEINDGNRDIGDMKDDQDLDDADEVERTHDYFCGGDDDGNSAYDSETGNAEKVHRHGAKLICSVDAHPRSLTELMNIMCDPFKIDYGTIKGICLETYKEEKTKAKHVLRNMDGQVSLSVDLLRHERLDGNDEEFVCLAAHFIDDSWKMKRWVLCFRLIWGSNFVSPYKAVLESLKDWEIEQEISTLTWENIYLDDGDEEDEFVEMVKNQVQEKKKLQLDGQLFHVKCCAAMFKSMVEDTFEEISKITDKVRELTWSKSEPSWYLTTSKLKNALELESMGEFSSQPGDIEYDVPSRDEWKKVECVCRLAEIAYNIAKELFETKYPTANIYLHNLQELRIILTKESSGSCAFTSNLAKKMLVRLDKYLKSNFLVLAIASVMDPRYKMKYREYVSSKCKGIDGDPQVERVLDAIRSLYEDYVNNDMGRQNSEGGSTSADSEEEFRRRVDQFSNSNLLQEYKHFVQTNEQSKKSDLELYLEEPVVPWSKDFNALKWWRKEGPKYPTLSKMARDILAIPVSTATSFEAYYTVQRPAHVEDLAPGMDFANALMCTRSWLKKQ